MLTPAQKEKALHWAKTGAKWVVIAAIWWVIMWLILSLGFVFMQITFEHIYFWIHGEGEHNTLTARGYEFMKFMSGFLWALLGLITAGLAGRHLEKVEKMKARHAKELAEAREEHNQKY